MYIIYKKHERRNFQSNREPETVDVRSVGRMSSAKPDDGPPHPSGQDWRRSWSTIQKMVLPSKGERLLKLVRNMGK